MTCRVVKITSKEEYKKVMLTAWFLKYRVLDSIPQKDYLYFYSIDELNNSSRENIDRHITTSTGYNKRSGRTGEPTVLISIEEFLFLKPEEV